MERRYDRQYTGKADISRPEWIKMGTDGSLRKACIRDKSSKDRCITISGRFSFTGWMHGKDGRPLSEYERFGFSDLKKDEHVILSLDQDWNNVHNPETGQMEYVETWSISIAPKSRESFGKLSWDKFAGFSPIEKK